MTASMWKDARDAFVQQACAAARLPLEGYRPRAAGQETFDRPSKKQRLQFAGEMLEASEIMDTPAHLLKWTRPERCFLLISDSKILADVIGGRAALQHDSDIPILETIVNRSYGILCLGWRPSHLHQDPVAWMPRAHNKVADGLADLTMDRAVSWSRRYPLKSNTINGNIVIQTDGGRRSDHCAAASFVIGLVSLDQGMWTYEP